MEIKAVQGSLTEIECDALIVNLFEGVKSPAGGTGAVDAALDGIISKHVLEADEFKGKFGDTYVIPTYGKIPAKKVVLVGLGKQEEFDLNKVRKVAAKAIRKAMSMLKAKKVASILHGAGIAGLSAFDCAQMITEGTILGSYKFDKYKSKKQGAEEGNANPEFCIVELDSSKIGDIGCGIEKGQIIAEAVNFARDLVNEPAEVVTPSKLAEIALSLEGIETKVMEKDEVERLGMGAYLAVARGSAEPLKFIHMAYKPANPKAKLAVVGKGITFDSGGLDIKPASGMVDMKTDMAGAAATIATMRALAKFNPQVEVHGIVASCENMPGGKAYKPGDVLKAKNGKTIEVDNTDAEGRLTLADALCYAEELQVDKIVDLATLTGACVVALGSIAAGVMGNDQELLDDIIESAEKGGERLWQLPLYEEYMEQLKSDISDFKNSGGREAGASSAGCFLKEFVKQTPWVHIDIAGPARLSKEVGELSKGPSGIGVRTLLNYILSL